MAGNRWLLWDGPTETFYEYDNAEQAFEGIASGLMDVTGIEAYEERFEDENEAYY